MSEERFWARVEAAARAYEPDFDTYSDVLKNDALHDAARALAAADSTDPHRERYWLFVKAMAETDSVPAYIREMAQKALGDEDA